MAIPDELESMLHVLIYHAVRYLRSDIPDNDEVARWLEATYDAYFVHGKEILCGERKGLIVAKLGRLVRWQPRLSDYVSVVFKSPLDTLIYEILQSFKAHYEVRNAAGLGVQAAETGVQGLADLVKTHAWMRSLFEIAADDNAWDPLDKVGDRVPEGWKGNLPTIPTALPQPPPA